VMGVRDTLLLDQGYQPLEIIPWQRALVMHLLGKVELLTAHGWSVQTVSRSFPAPAVVRLLRTIRHRPLRIRFSRDNVVLRDGHRCQYCGGRFSARELTLDHVIPRAQGGETSWTNVVAACTPCNRRKGRLTPEEAGMPLLSRPHRPRWLASQVLSMRKGQLPAPWRDWIH